MYRNELVYNVLIFFLEPIIATPPGSMTAQDNDVYWFGGGLGGRTSSVPVVVANQHQQQQHGLNGSRQLQRRRRPAPPQFRPQPLEPPPPPPALSVAFTAVACPWWTVLEGEQLFFSLPNTSTNAFARHVFLFSIRFKTCVLGTTTHRYYDYFSFFPFPTVVSDIIKYLLFVFLGGRRRGVFNVFLVIR